MSTKKKIKLGLAEIFGRVGVNKLLLSLLSSNRNPIFTFHRVLNPDDISDDNITCPFIQQAMFKFFICHALSKFKFISLNELVEGVRIGKIPKRSAAVTFDDGWKDNFDYAYPVLKELRVPATIFLVSSWVGTHKVPWSMDLYYLLKNIEGSGDLLRFLDFLRSRGIEIHRNFRGNRKSIIYDLNGQLKKWKIDLIEILLSQISDQFGISSKSSSEKRSFLNLEEILEMRRHQIDFGSHSQNHVILTNESKERALNELRKSKEEIEEKIGKKVVAFSYPNGNYNEAIMEQVRDLGYEYACSTEPGWVSKKENIFALKRIDIHQNLFAGISKLIPPDYLDFILYDSEFRK